MKKIIFSLLLVKSFLSADFLYVPNNICISTYSISNTFVFMKRSDNGLAIRIKASDFNINDVKDGFFHNRVTGMCELEPINNTLGISNKDFNYVNTVVGVIIFLLLSVSLL